MGALPSLGIYLRAFRFFSERLDWVGPMDVGRARFFFLLGPMDVLSGRRALSAHSFACGCPFRFLWKSESTSNFVTPGPVAALSGRHAPSANSDSCMVIGP